MAFSNDASSFYHLCCPHVWESINCLSPSWFSRNSKQLKFTKPLTVWCCLKLEDKSLSLLSSFPFWNSFRKKYSRILNGNPEHSSYNLRNYILFPKLLTICDLIKTICWKHLAEKISSKKTREKISLKEISLKKSCQKISSKILRKKSLAKNASLCQASMEKKKWAERGAPNQGNLKMIPIQVL